jgi:GntR family transcriptional regulator/MocR family aminotransferase
MKRAPEGLGPAVAVDRRLSLPLHRQIYDGYREAILDGRLRPGQRLPATRVLAQELRVSRIPVVTAFEQLVAEGYVESRVGAGSFVSSALPDVRPVQPGKRPQARPGPRHVPESRLPIVKEPWLALHGPFRASRPALDEFPAELWGRLVAKHARRLSPLQMGYGDPLGLPALREALAGYLRVVRSVKCTPEQIMIVSGSQQALALSSQALLDPGDAVWLEEPGYEGARDALKVAGARIIPVPVDEDGLDVAAGAQRGPDARAAYVTPSHQYPLGMIMSAPRRLQLLEWARKQGAWLFEDDYDSEYRYDGQGLSSLQGLDGDARVLYIGTFSKVLFPSLRVGYLVLPKDLVPRFRRLRGAMDISQEPFHQAVLAELIREGHYARHLRRMRGIYSERRRALETAFARELPGLKISGDNAGMHLVVLLKAKVNDHAIALSAAAHGISVIPLSSCFNGKPMRPGLILGYGSTRLNEIPEAVRRLKSLLE